MTTKPEITEREAFDLAYSCAVENGWFSTKGLARYIWNKARAAQPASVAVPDGYALVPIKPTQSINETIHLLCDDPGSFEDSEAFWQYLLAAAPAPVQQAAEQSAWVVDGSKPDKIGEGDYGYLIVCVERKRNGERYTFPAVYLNKYALYSEDDPTADEDGHVLATGWYDIKQHYDYDNWFTPLLEDGDKVVAWQYLPSLPEVPGHE